MTLPRGLAVATVTGAVAAALLAVQIAADPAPGMTLSESPFTDEGWSVIGSRNVLLLGRWATDEWQLAVAQLPFNVATAISFWLFGVGIIQARLVAIACSVLAVGLLSGFVGRRFGTVAGLAAGIGLATTPLFVYYGRLALLEPMVVAALVAGLVALLARPSGGSLLPGLLGGAAFALALGTKPSSVVPIAGIMFGAMVAGAGWRWVLGRRVAIAGATMLAVGIAWLVAVRLAGVSLARALQPWPEAGVPAPLDELWYRITDYVVRADDGTYAASAALMVAAVAGLFLAFRARHGLDPWQRALVGASVGWALLGFAVLVVVDYRPNRYAVPLLPPLAVLAGVGIHLVATRLPRHGRAAAAGLVVALAAGGVAAVAAWTASATHRLPQIQAELLELVEPPAPIEGLFAPTLAMRVPVPTIIVQGPVNEGDNYAGLGVRWLLLGLTQEPRWAADHPAAWAAREVLTCYPWSSGEACLIRVP